MNMKENKYLDRIYQCSPQEENDKINNSLIAEYDSWKVNPLLSYFSARDIADIKELSTSPRFTRNPKNQSGLFGELMKSRGFIFCGAGNNRKTYICTYDTRVVAKIGNDKVGARANLREFYNQNILKPFCSKVYEVEPEGYLALDENVVPIKDEETFEMFQDFIYDIFVYKIMLRGIAISDAGKRSFKNWGIRRGNFPVLLDYPDMYATDPKKHYCTRKIDEYGHTCNHPIVYSSNLDTLECSVCHQTYLPIQLAAKDGGSYTSLLKTANMYNENTEGTKMIIKFTNGNQTIVKDLSNNSTRCVCFDNIPKRRKHEEAPSNVRFTPIKEYADGTIVRPETNTLGETVKVKETNQKSQQNPQPTTQQQAETVEPKKSVTVAPPKKEFKKKANLHTMFFKMNNILNIDNFRDKKYSGLSVMLRDHFEEIAEHLNIEYNRNSFNDNFKVFEIVNRNVKGATDAYETVIEAAKKFLKTACVWDLDVAYDCNYRWDVVDELDDKFDKVYNVVMVKTLFNKIKELLHLISVVGMSKNTLEDVDTSSFLTINEEDLDMFDRTNNNLMFVASTTIDGKRFYAPINEISLDRYKTNDDEEEPSEEDEDTEETETSEEMEKEVETSEECKTKEEEEPESVTSDEPVSIVEEMVIESNVKNTENEDSSESEEVTEEVIDGKIENTETAKKDVVVKHVRIK